MKISIIRQVWRSKRAPAGKFPSVSMISQVKLDAAFATDDYIK